MKLLGALSDLNKERIQSAIKEAREYVSDEEEPWKSLAFQVILSRLISESDAPPQPERKAEEEPVSQRRAEIHDESPELSIPEHSLEKILALKEREQIPILWSLASAQSMTVDEFLQACTRAGVTISQSYSPTKGGNFRNRLVKQDKMFLEDGKVGKVPRYKLSASGKLKVQKLFDTSN